MCAGGEIGQMMLLIERQFERALVNLSELCKTCDFLAILKLVAQHDTIVAKKINSPEMLVTPKHDLKRAARYYGRTYNE